MAFVLMTQTYKRLLKLKWGLQKPKWLIFYCCTNTNPLRYTRTDTVIQWATYAIFTSILIQYYLLLVYWARIDINWSNNTYIWKDYIFLWHFSLTLISSSLHKNKLQAYLELCAPRHYILFTYLFSCLIFHNLTGA